MAERAASNPASPAVGVLLINFGAPEITVACIDELLRCVEDVAVRIYLLDNGSGADAESALAEAAAARPEVEFVACGENLGYCVATNRGLEWARAEGMEFVLLLNNDVQVEPGFLAPLLATLRHDASVAGVVPTILRGDGKVWAQGAEVGFAPNMNRLLGEGRAPAPREAGPVGVGYLPGACVLYRLADLLALGGLDESYFMYFEDAQLGERLRIAGRKLVWLPWVRVVHDASASSGGGRSPLRKYMTAVNSQAYLRSHFRWSMLASFLLFDVIALPLAYVRGVRAGWAKTKGIWDGLRGHRVTASDVRRWLPT